MKKSFSIGFKASIAYFLSSVISSGIAYITTPIFTRMLSSDEYGTTSIFFTWLNLFGIVAMFSFGNGVFNNGMSDYPEDRNTFSFSILVLSNIITLVFSLFLFAFVGNISQIIKLDKPMIWLMVIIFMFQPAYNFWYVRQRYEYKYKISSAFSILIAVLSPIIAIFCMILFKDNRLYARIFGAEATFILFYIGFYIYLGCKAKWNINYKYWKYCFFFNLPLIPHYLSMYLLNSCDKIMISKIVDDSATAYYSVAYSVAALALIIWSAINGSLLPLTYECCKSKNYSKINKITTPVLTLYGVASFIIILIAPEVIKIMAPKSYIEAMYVIPPVIAGVFFQVQYHLYANVLYYYKKTKLVMFASIISAIVNIILNYYGIKLFGYLAAGYTTLICYGIQAFIDYIAMKTTVKEEIYNKKSIILLSVLMTFFSIVSVFIYDYSIIRYLLIMLLLLALIIKRKIILNNIKDLIKS